MLNMIKLEALNDAQRKAVMHGEGPLLVLAGPGSGKTFTITQRIQYLIEVMQVPPEEILVITFTREAALSMQRRFQEQSSRIYPVNFGTFHSVFYQILKNINPSHTKNILRESQKKNLILPIIKQCDKASAESTGEVLTAISYYKNTGDMEQAVLKLPEEKRMHFWNVFEAYEKARRQQGAIDFDDMVYECAEALKRNPSARAYWSRRFTHILMDEFQDINPMQYQVINLLVAEPYNLFAVGDDDQAIYGFRGSRPACMHMFVEDYKAEKILLNTNYRSYPDIVRASLQVIDENKERFIKELQPCAEKAEEERQQTAPDGKSTVSLCPFIESEEQYKYLTECLASKSENDTYAVLFRTNMQLQSFAARLNRLGIPYEMKEKAASIYEHFIVKDIMAYLRIGAGEQKRELFLQILHKPARSLSREALYSKEENTTGNITIEAMRTYYQRQHTIGVEASYVAKAEKALTLLEKQLHYLKNASPYLGVQYICKVIGYERYLGEESRKQSGRTERLEEWKQILEWIKEDAKQYDNLQEWISAQNVYEENMSEKAKNTPAGTVGESADKVQLMTVHGSKGLEFDRVYIPDCNEKVFPHGSMPDKETCEEERRIFYVAMTRAKKSLELLYLTGTKERPRLPSRFLNPLLNGNR